MNTNLPAFWGYTLKQDKILPTLSLYIKAKSVEIDTPLYSNHICQTDIELSKEYYMDQTYVKKGK